MLYFSKIFKHSFFLCCVKKEDIQKKLRVLRSPPAKIEYLNRIIGVGNNEYDVNLRKILPYETRNAIYDFLLENYSKLRFSRKKLYIDCILRFAEMLRMDGRPEDEKKAYGLLALHFESGAKLQSTGGEEYIFKEKRDQLKEGDGYKQIRDNYSWAIKFARKAGDKKLANKILGEYKEAKLIGAEKLLKAKELANQQRGFKGLLKKILGSVLILISAGLIFSLSNNPTGFAISNLSNPPVSLSVALAIVSLITGFWLWFNK